MLNFFKWLPWQGWVALIIPLGTIIYCSYQMLSVKKEFIALERAIEWAKREQGFHGLAGWWLNSNNWEGRYDVKEPSN